MVFVPNVPVFAYQNRQLDTGDPASSQWSESDQQADLMEIVEEDGTGATVPDSTVVGAPYLLPDGTTETNPFNRALGDTQ